MMTKRYQSQSVYGVFFADLVSVPGILYGSYMEFIPQHSQEKALGIPRCGQKEKEKKKRPTGSTVLCKERPKKAKLILQLLTRSP